MKVTISRVMLRPRSGFISVPTESEVVLMKAIGFLLLILYSMMAAGPKPRDLRSLIGHRVTLRGKFSLRGKIGPFVLVKDRPVYIVAAGSFTPGQPYSSLEGRIVKVTGILRFRQFPPEPEPVDAAKARVPDYFYFEAETARVRLARAK
jgi:hypothetical protein